ncbi:transposase [Candidatus Woesebacteria bacterium]|nr:transposase [Candidatus Woesebacteria bacterium]
MRYHPRATTNTHIRQLIQESKESSPVLAARFGINRKTVLKWKKRQGVTDAAYGTKTLHYRLTPWHQKIIVKVRKHLKVTLDDLVVMLKDHIPAINRDNAYRVLVRHQLNTLPSAFDNRQQGKFGYYLPGFIHIDLAYLPILPGSHQRRYLLVAIDRITKLVFVMVVAGKTQKYAIEFLKTVVRWLPYRGHRVLTDNGREFGKKFTAFCNQLGIKHKRTKVKHPWTNGQVERIIQTIKDATVKQIYYPDYQQLTSDLLSWQNNYNTNKKLKSIKYLTPYQKMVNYYQSLDKEKRNQRFKIEPVVGKVIVPLYRAT